jgi:hypothetical protein
MAKPVPAKQKSAAPAVTARKKAKAEAVAPKKKAVAVAPRKKTEAIAPTKKKAVAVAPTKKAAGKKAAAPKMAPAPKKAAAKAPSPKKLAVKGKAPAVKKVAAAPKKATARKVAAPAKTAAKSVAVKKAAPRRTAVRTAVPTPAARRGRPAAAPPKAPARKLGNGAPQVFTVSHLNEADFKAEGLRAYAQYRDLGIAAATGGLCQAHVIRLIPPCTDEVRKRHVHHADLQLVYVLKGWMKNVFEGHGEQMMSVGSCWLQPTGIKHTVLDYSPDCEVLEIIVPADFKTEEVA